MNQENQQGNGGWLGSRRSLVLIGFLAIIGFFLFTEHRAHVFDIPALSVFVGLPVHALLYAWASWEARGQW